MSNPPLVTIGIPTYNRGDSRLKRVLDAARDQSWSNIEIIVSDNASTDETEEFMRSVQDPRVRYVRQANNIGANANFNYLLNAAAGEWFLLLHDDDHIDVDFISSCMSIVEPGCQFGFVRTGVRSIDINGTVLKETPNRISGQTREDFYFSWFAAKTATFLCSTLFHTERLRDVGGFDSLHYLLEDNYALVKLLEQWQHGVVEDVKASYRYTYDQRTYNVPVQEWCEDFRQLLDMITRQCQPESRKGIWLRGNLFFRQLCMLRARAISNPVKRASASLSVLRHFGFSSMRYSLLKQRTH